MELKEILTKLIASIRSNIYPLIANRSCSKENYDYYTGALDALKQIELAMENATATTATTTLDKAAPTNSGTK